jgi:hypothetical protein
LKLCETVRKTKIGERGEKQGGAYGNTGFRGDMTLEKKSRLRIPPECRKTLKVVFRQERGRKLTDTIRALNLKMRDRLTAFSDFKKHL